MYEHVVFDLDGTLIDSRQDLADAANALLARHAAPPLPVADIVAMVGEGARTLVARVLARAGLDVNPEEALSTFLGVYDERLAVHTRPYDGIVPALEALTAAGCRLSVLTNKPQRATDRVLDALGLRHHFAAVLGGDSDCGTKPDPRGLHRLVQDAGLGSAVTVMVGDSWIDAHTAAAAGLDACLVSYGFGYASVPPATRASVRWTLASPAELSGLARLRRPAPSMPPVSQA